MTVRRRFHRSKQERECRKHRQQDRLETRLRYRIRHLVAQGLDVSKRQIGIDIPQPPAQRGEQRFGRQRHIRSNHQRHTGERSLPAGKVDSWFGGAAQAGVFHVLHYTDDLRVLRKNSAERTKAARNSSDLLPNRIALRPILPRQSLVNNDDRRRIGAIVVAEVPAGDEWVCRAPLKNPGLTMRCQALWSSGWRGAGNDKNRKGSR